jgi:hypothetical protein
MDDCLSRCGAIAVKIIIVNYGVENTINKITKSIKLVAEPSSKLVLA